MRRAVRVVLCIAAISVPALASSTSASATACPSGRSCVWKDVGYVTNGSPYSYFGYTNYSRQYSAHNYLGTTDQVHDDVTSLHNNGNYDYARYFVDSYCGGPFFNKPPKTGVFNLSDTWDNKLDSGYFYSYSYVC
jgi:hypothetical protein